MACPLGKLKPEASDKWGNTGLGRLKKIFNIIFNEILPRATTGTLMLYHLCFFINKKYKVTSMDIGIIKCLEAKN